MIGRVYVGDPHAVVAELAECRRLMDAVIDWAVELGIQEIVLLGDLVDTMSVGRLEVMDFWRDVFQRGQARRVEFRWVCGNHDQSNDGSSSWVWYFHPLVAPVTASASVVPGVLEVPFMRDPEAFVRVCQDHASWPVVVCHQAFTVSRYEDAGGRYPGVYAGKDGVDAERLPQELVIAGHVHKPGRYGKVWHPGSPRWRTAADANEPRAVWAVIHGDDGRVQATRALDTAPFCRRIVHLDDSPEGPAEIPTPGELLEVRVDVRGPTEYVLPRVEELLARGVRAKAFRTDAVRLTVRESDGVEVAWGKHLRDYVPARGTASARVAELAAESYGLRAG